ncbi:MAG: hypothetical protein AAGG80_01800 [Pseudomonadota bacterium]
MINAAMKAWEKLKGIRGFASEELYLIHLYALFEAFGYPKQKIQTAFNDLPEEQQIQIKNFFLSSSLLGTAIALHKLNALREQHGPVRALQLLAFTIQYILTKNDNVFLQQELFHRFSQEILKQPDLLDNPSKVEQLISSLNNNIEAEQNTHRVAIQTQVQLSIAVR